MAEFKHNEVSWKHNKLTDEEIKEIVRGVYDGKIFTSFQCRDMVHSVFMPLIFLGGSPTKPTATANNQENRKRKLQYIEDCLDYELQTPARDEYMNSIGMLYENISKAGPMSVNGYPIFYSCHIMSSEDAKRFLEMYQKYEKMREEFEKEWKK